MLPGSRLLSRSFGHTKQRIGLIYILRRRVIGYLLLASGRQECHRALPLGRRISIPAMIKLSGTSGHCVASPLSS